MAYPSTFSEEEIHDILGAMNSHDDCSHEEHGGHHDDGTGISADSRAKARSERKRSREKQRREDVNKHFGDLTQLLRQVEADDDDGNKWIPIPTVGPTNRVDLIARTIVVLERVHRVSMKRKLEIEDLNKQLEDMKKIAEDTTARLKEATMYQQGPQKPQVMMMVPMMVNPESLGGSAGATAGFMPQLQQQMPFMPQQMMMMPQMTPAQAPAPQQQSGSNTSSSATMPTLQMMQQMMQPMMQQQHMMMQPQQMPYATMMFPSQASSSNPPAAAAAVTSQQPSDAQQQRANSQPQQQSDSSTGGNLAHCA